ncbi:MAG TPA: response regulator [Thermoanaerobaculia bacterium]|nr:response regulator [Thermoanaerobaculia bacterium]
MAKKILLADDSLTIQKVVELTFSDSEYELVCVSNGQRVLDRIESGEMPDLILADVVMPEKNGYEVCEAIKANPATARIPVVLLSGTFEPFDRDRADRLGCDAIVSKPFDSQQLLRQVEALLARPANEMPAAATMAIPVMTMAAPVPPPPPPPAAPHSPGEAGFAPEDFTGSIRLPAPVAGGADMFEEEYGQVDVESAIAAFEKAHPEFEYGDATEPGTGSVPGDVAPDAEPSHPEPAPAAEWLNEERESAAPPPPPAPAPFWVPRAPETELAPIPFGADDSGVRHQSGADVESQRADEAPTQQIPLAAEYAALGRMTDAPADRETDPTAPRAPEERTAELDLAETRSILAAPPAPPAPSDGAGVPSEIEVLAQNTSIGQLKEMLSSVSRPEGGLSDDEIDRLASRVVERLSERIVREIAWEVIPDVAEIVIKQRIRELESGVE